MPGGRPSPDIFRRRAVERDDCILIESTCERCGAVFVGNVTEGLTEWENTHQQTCRKPKDDKASGKGAGQVA